MSKQRREQSQDSIFVDNPFVDGFLEWMGSREGRQCIEVRDVLWDLLEDAELDAKQRQLIWPDAERLDLVQSIQRIQKLYPDFPGHEIEEVLLNWIDMGYDPENYSQAQLNELDSLTERWVADHLRNANASKTRKRTRHSLRFDSRFAKDQAQGRTAVGVFQAPSVPLTPPRVKLCRSHQIRTRFCGTRNRLSLGLTLKASYQASMFRTTPLTRYFTGA